MSIPYERIVADAADALIYADRNGYIRVWNAGAEAVFGFSAAEAVGQYLDLIIPQKLREAHWRGFNSAIERGATVGGRRARPTRGLHKDPDRRLYVEMSFAVVLGADGGAVGSVAMARDITERYLKERAARR